MMVITLHMMVPTGYNIVSSPKRSVNIIPLCVDGGPKLPLKIGFNIKILKLFKHFTIYIILSTKIGACLRQTYFCVDLLNQ